MAIIFIAGLPATGKSTIAREVTALLGASAKNLDIDEIKRQVVNSDDLVSDIDPDFIRMRYYLASINQAISLIDEGVCNVVVEEVFHRRYLRKYLNKKCIEAGIEFSWFQILCDAKLVEKRLKERPRRGHILDTEQTLLFHHKFMGLFDSFDETENCLKVENKDNPFMVASKIIVNLSENRHMLV